MSHKMPISQQCNARLSHLWKCSGTVKPWKKNRFGQGLELKMIMRTAPRKSLIQRRALGVF
jgi:hypothetical protein